MEIRSNNVTIKNFGVKDAKTGIVIAEGEDRIAETITLENLEVHSCLRALEIPERSQNLRIVDSILLGK
jgi:hypothetical protein